jgi:hypothetical protein
MTDFGRFRLAYEPSDHSPFGDVLDHSVEMTISGEASLENMTSFFTCFLRACGYIVDGELQVVESEEAFNKEYWQNKYLELLKAPESQYPYCVTSPSSQGVDFISFSNNQHQEE